MSDQNKNWRYQAGKHLALVEDTHLPYIANIPRYIIPAFAVWRELCGEAAELVHEGRLDPEIMSRVSAVHRFLDDSLRLSVSADARGRTDLTSAIRGLEEDRIHRDAGMRVFDPAASERQDKKPKQSFRGL